MDPMISRLAGWGQDTPAIMFLFTKFWMTLTGSPWWQASLATSEELVASPNHDREAATTTEFHKDRDQKLLISKWSNGSLTIISFNFIFEYRLITKSCSSVNTCARPQEV